VAAVVIVAGLVTGLLLALGGGKQAETTSTTPSPAARLRSPFTGEPVASLSRVLAVKIDNIVNARPQTGLTHADIVYVLPVEGGLSRFLAPRWCCVTARPGPRAGRGRPRTVAPRSPPRPDSG
jgi:Protein of unknown function (DUF3048) N-terminal domain